MLRTLGVIVLAAAATAPTSPPTVDQILDKYVEALGGRAAILRLNSRVSKGTFEATEEGVAGSVENYAMAPNKWLFVLEVPEQGALKQGFDGMVAWKSHPGAGVSEMAGQELSNARRNAVFHQPLRLRELYPKMSLQGEDKVGERAVYKIEADPGDGSLRRFYFDKDSGLLLRTTIERDTRKGRSAVELLLEDYRVVDGMKLPFTVHQSSPEMRFTIRYNEIVHNVAIDDAKFAKGAVP